MAQVFVRPEILYAWHAQSLLVVDRRGDCGEDETLSGYYFREARFLRTLRLEIDGQHPWLCEAAVAEPDILDFTYVHPELAEFGGGGSGQSGDEVTTDAYGIPHRALDIRLRYTVNLASLTVAVTIANRSSRDVAFGLAWVVGADFADMVADSQAAGFLAKDELSAAAIQRILGRA